jgi:tetratricopeptide (TPR) repeat protein
MAKGASLLESDREAAADCYQRAVELDPDLHEAWFDLGLVHKWAGRWEEAFACNLRAAELLGEVEEEPAWWNLGIAATALHRWDVARRAWRAYGVDMPDGAGPIEADFGYGAVRLNRQSDPEVVWGQRIDPARIRLTNIPYPSSGHCWADVVLHDGAPNGYREVDGQQHPVFDELLRWAPSDVPTVEASISADAVDDLDQLIATIVEAGHAAEDWTRNVRTLCRRCSEGTVHAEHEEEALVTGREHWVGIAAPLADATAIVRRWERSPGRRCHSIELASSAPSGADG